MATSRHIWPECPVVKGHFWKMADENRTEAQIPFEQSFDSSWESTTPEYKTPFMVYKESDGTFINPRWILRLRIERAEVA